jgi:phospholipid/cholesterol/gamma-HCH transport system permease protein
MAPGHDVGTIEAEPHAPATVEVEQAAPNALLIRLSGSWRLEEALPSPDDAQRRLESVSGLRRVVLEGRAVTRWDSSLVAFLGKVLADTRRRQLEVDTSGLPGGVQRLLTLAAAVPPRQDTEGAPRPWWLARLGLATQVAARRAVGILAFLGEVVACLPRLFRGAERFRRTDFFLILQECGSQALPIVSLISFLVGVILAYVGAIQLRQFGAQVYVADLVGIATTREMGAMMAGIIMAGRTGAAFAAQLGTMQVNEEIDALRTLGIPPVEFLVLPRMLALATMMPLLTVYADLMGVLGGAAVGLGMLDIGPMEYYLRTVSAVTLHDVVAGLIKGSVFGVLVAIAGCLRGMECGRSSAAVGWAATSAVVTGIVCIIVSDAVLTVIFDIIGL